MDDSTQDPYGPLNELKKPSNVFTAVRELQAVQQPQDSAQADASEEVFASTGVMVVDELIAPAPDVTVLDPTDTTFYGAGVTGGGRTFGSLIMNFWAVAAGVLQAGFNNLGQLLAGAGAVIMDAAGITISALAAYANVISIKWSDGGSNVFVDLYGTFASTIVAMSQQLVAFGNRDAYTDIQSTAATGKRARINLWANVDAISVGYQADTTSKNSFFGDVAMDSALAVTGNITGANLSGTNTGNQLGFIFGDGSDGNVTISGNTTLTKDMNYNNLTVNAGVTLSCAGFIPRVLGILTIAATGVISCDGGAGGAGNLGTGAGGAAGLVPYSSHSIFSVAGAGGTGEGSSAAANVNSAGGIAGAATITPAGLLPSIFKAGCGGGGGGMHGTTDSANKTGGSTVGGASGGNGGAGTGSSAGASRRGAGGGAGGGILMIFATIINNAGSIQAKGGVGGNGVTSTDQSGNGGGGGGGAVIVYYRSVIGSGVGTMAATKGLAGTGGNGGGAGVDGITGSFQA